MTEPRRVQIQRLGTSVPGLDQVLGGGLPEYSFNLIAGEPGSGKTTLVQQIMFANATEDRTAIYFTVLGEPPLKMLRYQQQFAFFDFDKIDESIRFVNLSQEVLDGDLNRVLERIVEEVERTGPGIVIVDSFRTVVRSTEGRPSGELELQSFVQRLALHLTGWQSTTFLVGEYTEREVHDNPVFTVADTIIWLRQDVERTSVMRRLQVVKVRGQAPLPGMHSMRITDEGIHVFPRMLEAADQRTEIDRSRISTGVRGLDEMMGGGIPAGDATLVSGPAGSGKTILAMRFAAEAARNRESAVIAVFEERPGEYLRRARELGIDLHAMEEEGRLRVLYLRPMDLSVDETLLEIRSNVTELGASRVVIDSLSGFEIAVGVSYRNEYREALYRLVAALTGQGTTVLMTMESIERYDELRFTGHEISFLADNIILQRYAELDGHLRKVILIVKMRGSDHSKALRTYEITSAGIEIGGELNDYRGIITGVPELRRNVVRYPGLSEAEIRVLRLLDEQAPIGAEAVVRTTGLSIAAAQAALDRLVELRYALQQEGQYRPVGKPLGD